MPSIFTRIVQGEIPCHKVYEDDDHLAFLDINPTQPGHTLVIPKRETSYLFDMDEASYTALWNFVRRVELALRQATDATRVVVTVVGYEVPHVHVHLVPTKRIEDYPPFERSPIDQDTLAPMAARIATFFA